MASNQEPIGFCGKCGSPAYEGQEYCIRCGNKLAFESNPYETPTYEPLYYQTPTMQTPMSTPIPPPPPEQTPTKRPFMERWLENQRVRQQRFEESKQRLEQATQNLRDLTNFSGILPQTLTKTMKGKGQKATQKFPLHEGLATFSMTHSGRRHFSVTLLDSRGNRIALLANKVGTFNGSKALGIQESGTYLLDIHADGDWTVRIEQ